MRHIFRRLFHRCGLFGAVLFTASVAHAGFSDGFLAAGAFDVQDKPVAKSPGKAPDPVAAAATVAPQPVPAVPQVSLQQALRGTNKGCSSGRCGQN